MYLCMTIKRCSFCKHILFYPPVTKNYLQKYTLELILQPVPPSHMGRSTLKRGWGALLNTFLPNITREGFGFVVVFIKILENGHVWIRSIHDGALLGYQHYIFGIKNRFESAEVGAVHVNLRIISNSEIVESSIEISIVEEIINLMYTFPVLRSIFCINVQLYSTVNILWSVVQYTLQIAIYTVQYSIYCRVQYIKQSTVQYMLKSTVYMLKQSTVNLEVL